MLKILSILLKLILQAFSTFGSFVCVCMSSDFCYIKYKTNIIINHNQYQLLGFLLFRLYILLKNYIISLISDLKKLTRLWGNFSSLWIVKFQIINYKKVEEIYKELNILGKCRIGMDVWWFVVNIFRIFGDRVSLIYI